MFTFPMSRPSKPVVLNGMPNRTLKGHELYAFTDNNSKGDGASGIALDTLKTAMKEHSVYKRVDSFVKWYNENSDQLEIVISKPDSCSYSNSRSRKTGVKTYIMKRREGISAP